MSIKITRTGLERAVVAEEPRPPAMLPGEYAGRLWLRLLGIDPGGVLVLTSEQLDARVLAQAREIMLRRFPEAELGTTGYFADTLAHWVKRLNRGE